jgi:hypothetical protein
MWNRVLRLAAFLALLWLIITVFLCVGMWNNGFAPHDYLENEHVDRSSFIKQKKAEQDQRFRDRGWIK